MAEETVTIGDTDVEIRETEDGFVASEASPASLGSERGGASEEAVEAEDEEAPLESFEAELRANPYVSKVSTSPTYVRFSYNTASAEFAGEAVYIPDGITVERMEANSGFDSSLDGGMYVVARLDDE